jgi:peptidoglycan/xylan/chitin deacetylase (PgdA/CDA1 family)
MTRREVTIVMYHYVRPIAASAWPRIKGLEFAKFQGQLDYIQRHYRPITMKQLIAAAAGAERLPDNPILLTFDDGYSDHYHYAFMELAARRLSGAFFVPACAMIDRRILDVNRIHYILAAVEDAGALATHVDRAVLDAADEFGLPAPAALRKATRNLSRWDTPEVAYVKRMLQDGLPSPLRRRLIDELFARFVTIDPLSFAEELYLTVDQAREMAAGGMHIGSHGESHERLALMDADSQRREIAESLRIFAAIGQSAREFTFCYPYGSYDRRTVSILEDLGCSAAVTTKVALAAPNRSAVLELPRIDTNDLPVTRDAEPGRWTRDAAL